MSAADSHGRQDRSRSPRSRDSSADSSTWSAVGSRKRPKRLQPSRQQQMEGKLPLSPSQDIGSFTSNGSTQ